MTSEELADLAEQAVLSAVEILERSDYQTDEYVSARAQAWAQVSAAYAGVAQIRAQQEHLAAMSEIITVPTSGPRPIGERS